MNVRKIKITAFTFVCMLLLVAIGNAQSIIDEKHIEVSLRMIGHQILLNSKDSTSRVLPLIKNDNQYSIEFDSEFEFSPDELVTTVNRIVKESKLARRYILEVEKCENGQVVYSYKMDGLEKSNIIPCAKRTQPKSCYRLVFTLLEAKETTAALQNAGPTDSSPQKTDLLNYLIPIGIVLLIAGLLLFYLWRKKKKTVSNPNLIPLGEYLFDKQNTALIIKKERIPLTGKEADLLLLLYKTVNTTVEREVILNKIWGDEGDYVGRTLDVFISKLRKKLANDPKVKIVNIRGVGYKLLLGA